jgi:DNA-binding transcriptional ArsR family regulator
MAAIKRKLLEPEGLREAAELLRALGHPARIRMVQMLLDGEYTVGELAEACPSHTASEHLRLMQRCGFLTCRREGRRRYYQRVDPCLRNLMGCIEHRFGEPTG